MKSLNNRRILMKHFNKISKVLLIVVAIVGLAIGMSSGDGDKKSTDNANSTISADNTLMDSKCGEGKCGGDNVKAEVSDKVGEAKEAVTDAKCGEGKCGGDDAKIAVTDKVSETKEAVTDAKCGEGKCG
jgi:uncharacterized low-complexity protein